ncbi:MAG: hypothetical protein ACLP5H_29745 [Desulfomonilaceae bacterium]
MTEKENPAVKPRKLKKLDEYKEKIPLAWRFYQREIEKGTDSREAELKAVKLVYPGDKNSSTTLSVWRKYGLWPPPEEMLSGKSSGVVGQSRHQGKNGLTVIPGGGQKKLKSLKAHTDNSDHTPDLSEKLILQGVRRILESIEVHHKEWTGGRMKKYSTLKTKVFAGRLPVDLLNEIHKFKGTDTYHLERALRLYVKIMGAK